MAVGKADQTRFCNAATVVGFLEATRKVEPALMAQLSKAATQIPLAMMKEYRATELCSAGMEFATTAEPNEAS